MLVLPLVMLVSAIHAKRPVICIDPGHPSEVGRGTSGRRLSEIHFAWIVSKELESALRHDGYTVVLTKSSEEQLVRNRERAEIANRSGAALLLRLHCDAASNSGSTIYYPDRTGTSGGRTGPSSKVLALSRATGVAFHAAYARALRGKLPDNGLLSDTRTAVGSRQGALTGSIYSEVPVLLVEMVVLTNPNDEAFALSTPGRRAIVGALRAGVWSAVPLHGAKSGVGHKHSDPPHPS